MTRTPPSEAILQEWQQHNPFERASTELIRQIQQLAKQPTQPQAEPAPF
jgi:ribosomal protein S21